MQDWLLMEEFPLNAPTLSHTDIVDALDSKCCEIIEDHATDNIFLPKFGQALAILNHIRHIKKRRQN